MFGMNSRKKEIAQLKEKLDKMTKAIGEIPQVAQAIGDPEKMDQLAQTRNKEKELHCTECCTVFRLEPDGTWSSGHKKAQLVAGRILFCTCDTPIGVIVNGIHVPGEVAAIH